MEGDFTHTVEPDLPGEDIRLFAPGAMIAGRFEIERPLGTGGYAVVYAAYDHELARRVAVKMLRPDRITPTTTKRMRREVAVAREVTSTRLVRLYDIGEHQGSTFLTMELVEGPSLRDELRSGPLAVDEAVRVADDVLQALGTLHAAGLIHRDLKPANVLVTPDRKIKLADFGLVRHWESNEIRATRTAALVGTLEYVSPEQALGKRLDPRSDLYSFGVMLYELLTGQLPFGAASSLGSAVARVTSSAPDIRRIRPDVPAWLADLIRRLLEREPRNRPRNVAAVRSALRAAKIDWSYRWRRARVGVITTAVVLFLVAIAGSFAWIRHESKFDHISAEGDTLHALDRRGRVLWSKERLPAVTRAATVSVNDGDQRIIGITLPPAPELRDAYAESAQPFSTWDAQSGKELESIQVQPPPPVFPLPVAFNLGGVYGVDINHDGLDEVVACYVHIPYWPSYTLLIDPRSRESGIILYASGHHRFLGTIDVDDDGTDEILLGGPNNRMGWRFGLAAVRVRPGSMSVGTRFIPVNTPDTAHNDMAGDPLWYTLLPRRASYAAHLDGVDVRSRTFDLLFDDNARTRLTFDGFSLDVPSQLPPSVRQKRRAEAYRLLRLSTTRERNGLIDSALVTATSAKQAAHDAGEPELEAWAATIHARMLVESDEPDEAVRRALDAALTEYDLGPELCWEVANTYSARVSPREAAYWYIRALDLYTGTGHTPIDYLRSAVVSLAEIGDWDRADHVIDDFIDAVPAQADAAKRLRSLVLWRTGSPVDPALTISESEDKFTTYVMLEHQWSQGVEDKVTFLKLVRHLLETTEESPWMRSLEADILSSLGRNDQALPIARMAMEEVTKDPTDPFARVSRDLVAERLRRIEQ